jgi:hypothetical protein
MRVRSGCVTAGPGVRTGGGKGVTTCVTTMIGPSDVIGDEGESTHMK